MAEKNVFMAGYSRVDITPDPSIIGLKDVHDPLFVTCVALSDGEQKVLVFSLDVKNFGRDICNQVKADINEALGVPVENIIMSATHNHSAPTPGGNSEIEVAWANDLYKKIVKIAGEALDDLDECEVSAGKGKSTGLAFVRRYFHEDGSFSGINYRRKSTTPVVRYESEADDSVGVLCFERKNKKNIVMVNWQAHVAHAIGKYTTSISGDLVGVVRNSVEAKKDVLLEYFQGASGNINLTVKVAGTGSCGGDFEKVGEALGDIVADVLDTKLERVNVGKFSTYLGSFTTRFRRETDERIANAKLVIAAGPRGSEEYNAALDKYDFRSSHEVDKVLALEQYDGRPSTQVLGAIGFGDIAFVAVPYEMFDTNGMAVKNASPYNNTFILTCAGGGVGYVPSALSVKNRGFEVTATNFEFGTAEMVEKQLIEVLHDLKNNN